MQAERFCFSFFLIIFLDPYFLFMQLLENLVFVEFPRFLLYLFSSPELAHGELLGYRDVRRTYGRPRRPSVNFLACVYSRGNSFDQKFMKLCQTVNHHNIKVKFETGSFWVKN